MGSSGVFSGVGCCVIVVKSIKKKIIPYLAHENKKNVPCPHYREILKGMGDEICGMHIHAKHSTNAMRADRFVSDNRRGHHV